MIFITGGSGSGKSALAEEICCKYDLPKYYLATMQIFGKEEEEKVNRHRLLRAGKGFTTIERTRDVGEVLKGVQNPGESLLLLECMSNLVANEMFCENPMKEDVLIQKIVEELRLLDEEFSQFVVVSNNVFEDGISYDESTKAYMRVLGKVNAGLAEFATEVYEAVVGIKVRVK